jgi:hypothetical protein
VSPAPPALKCRRQREALVHRLPAVCRGAVATKENGPTSRVHAQRSCTTEGRGAGWCEGNPGTIVPGACEMRAGGSSTPLLRWVDPSTRANLPRGSGPAAGWAQLKGSGPSTERADRNPLFAPRTRALFVAAARTSRFLEFQRAECPRSPCSTWNGPAEWARPRNRVRCSTWNGSGRKPDFPRSGKLV